MFFFVNGRRPHATQQSLDRAIFATKNVSLASPRRTFATLHLDLALWYLALAAASSFSSAFHWTKLLLAYAAGTRFSVRRRTSTSSSKALAIL